MPLATKEEMATCNMQVTTIDQKIKYKVGESYTECAYRGFVIFQVFMTATLWLLFYLLSFKIAIYILHRAEYFSTFRINVELQNSNCIKHNADSTKGKQKYQEKECKIEYRVSSDLMTIFCHSNFFGPPCW